ncbi:hypothetical protein SXCC_02900 [Gluconacetobacter sp. SXCC-1]|nr:hypothetical protein SXCC_02900 [Gluconacetobacter sp. SXCC-1]
MPQVPRGGRLTHEQQARQRPRHGADDRAGAFARAQVIYPVRRFLGQACGTMTGGQPGQGLGCRVIPVGGQGNGTGCVVRVRCGLCGTHAHAVPVASCCHAFRFTGGQGRCGTRSGRSRNYTSHWVQWIWGITSRDRDAMARGYPAVTPRSRRCEGRGRISAWTARPRAD